MTGQIPPPLLAQVVVLLFAAALAYCTAFTVFLEEIIQALHATIRLIEGDVSAGAQAAAVIAEREAGEGGTGVMRLFGKRQTSQTSQTATTTAQAFVAPAVSSARSIETAQTDADVAATEQFATTAPRTAVNARPVRADQLPRIGWTADPEAQAMASDTSMSPPAAEATAVTTPPAQDSPQAPDSPAQTLPLPPIPVRTPPSAPPALQSLTPASDDAQSTWSPPSSIAVLPPTSDDSGADQLAYGEAARPTRPLSRPNSQPLDVGTQTPSGRGIWSRISQALVGNTDTTSSDDTAPMGDVTPNDGVPPA